ncbi:MAG: hypothetical protein GX660_00100 [Clostridiaceae bacterium]|nr:hypothetical protein [Clostridiaceae bacterium]
MRFFILFGLFIFQLVILSACTVSKAENGPRIEVSAYEEKSIEVRASQGLEVSCEAGKIEVFTWDKRMIKFEITKKIRGCGEKSTLEEKINDFDIEIKEKESKIFFKSVFSSKSKKYLEGSTNMTVYIPKNRCVLNWKQNTGNIRFLDEIKGVLDFDLSSANLEINKLDGIISVKGDSGNVRISNGRISGQSSIVKNYGNIKVKAEFDENGDYEFKTGVGNIDLSLPGNSQLSVESVGALEINEFYSPSNPAKVRISSSMGSLSARKY